MDLNKNELRTVLHLSGILLGLIFFCQVFSKSILELGSLDNIFSPGSWKLVLALPIYGVVYILQMVNFRRILISCFHYKIRAAVLFKSYSLSFIAKYIPGAVWGYLSRGELLAKQGNVPIAYTWIASVIEIVITIASGSIIIAFYYMMVSGILYFWILAVIVVGLVFLWAVIPKGVRIASCLLKKEISANTIHLPLFDFITIFINGCIQWLLLGIGLLFITSGMGVKFPVFGMMPLIGSTSAFSAAWLGGFFVPFLPNGMGVREMTLVRLLMANLGVGAPVAGLAAIVSRVLLLVTEFGFVLIAVAIKPLNANEIK